MGDWKGQMSKVGGSSTVKKCACGRDINRPGTDICGVCYSKQRNGTGSTATISHGSSAQAYTLPAEYLQKGYFDGKGNLIERYLAKNGDA